jgi:hypothetical protein
LSALQGGQFREARRWLVDEDGRASVSPIAAVIRSGPDWLKHRLTHALAS